MEDELSYLNSLPKEKALLIAKLFLINNLPSHNLDISRFGEIVISTGLKFTDNKIEEITQDDFCFHAELNFKEKKDESIKT